MPVSRCTTEADAAAVELQPRLASESIPLSVLNSLPTHIAVLDSAGRILDVNESWMQFAREDGYSANAGFGLGTDYLQACRGALNSGDPCVAAALEGLQSVLSGQAQRFTLEYPCDSPTCARWFVMEVFRHLGAQGGAIVAHNRALRRV